MQQFLLQARLKLATLALTLALKLYSQRCLAKGFKSGKPLRRPKTIPPMRLLHPKLLAHLEVRRKSRLQNPRSQKAMENSSTSLPPLSEIISERGSN